MLVLFLLSGCQNKYTPKPRGFFRISFPDKEYIDFNQNAYPYRFEIPVYSIIKSTGDEISQPYDINITVPANKADLHITYKTVSSDSPEQKIEILLEDSRTLAYKHTIKADAIEERLFINPDEKVYGTIFFIEGNAASPIQFFLTDSTKHFLRGSLYIRNVPDVDSLRPVINFLEPDVIHLIESVSWK